MKAEEVYIKVKADTTDIDELEKKINKLSNETENIAKRLKESIEMLHKCNGPCICNTQLRGCLQNIGNTENTNNDLKLYIKDDGIMIFEKNICIGCFEINYCPKCGSKLVKK